MSLEWILRCCDTPKSSSQCRDVLQTATPSYTLSWPESLSFNLCYLLFLSKFFILMREKTNITVACCMLRQLICFYGHSFQFQSYAHDFSTSTLPWNFIVIYWLIYWQQDKEEIRHFIMKPFWQHVRETFRSKRHCTVYSFFPYLTICW